MHRSREVPVDPEVMAELTADLTMLDPCEFLILLEELEARWDEIKTEIEIETKGEHL